MKIKFVVIVSIVILLFAGCINKDTGIQIDKNKTDIYKNVTTILPNISVAIPTDKPETSDTAIEKPSEPENTPTRVTDTPIMSSKIVDWCKIGESIEQGTGTGMVKLDFKIKGLATYKGKEVCIAESSTEDFKFAYYFNEDNSYRIILATDPNGNTEEEKLN